MKASKYYLPHFSLYEVCSTQCSKEWFDDALNYWKRTGDVGGWHVLMYGA